jgi:hypothetical protein
LRTPGSSSLWQEACAQLPQKTRDEVTRSSPTNHKNLLQDILNDVESKKKICVSNQWTIKWRGDSIPVNDIVEKITSSINAFIDIGDQIALYDPAHFGLAWPWVKILLKVRTVHTSITLCRQAKQLTGRDGESGWAEQGARWDALHFSLPEPLCCL